MKKPKSSTKQLALLIFNSILTIATFDVTFAFMLTFRDGDLAMEAQNIDWGKELIENNRNLLISKYLYIARDSNF